MQLSDRTQPKVPHPELPQSASVSTLPASCQPRHNGLYMKWQVVEGKLTCRWMRNPD